MNVKGKKLRNNMPGGVDPLDIGVQIPYHFRCPISLELMRDPVTVCTGQTYDRSSIEAWVSTGNMTCPVTRVPLTDFTLIPNHTLRRLIQDWCVANRCFGVERIPTPKQPAEPTLVRSLLNQAASPASSCSVKHSALSRLRGLAHESEKNRAVIGGNGASGIMLSIALSNVGSEPSELNLEALGILSMFALSESECMCVAADAVSVGFLVGLLFHTSIEVRVNSMAVIESVAAGIRSPQLRAQISGAPGMFEGIVGILNYPLVHPRALKIGIKSLFAMCLPKQHRQRAVAAGAADALICRLVTFEKCDAERALATVELLCRIPSGCAAFAALPQTVALLVNIILKLSDRATEYAAGALLSLCLSSEGTRAEALAAGVLTQLLLLVQSDCTERAKRKAQMLLKLLRDSWPNVSSVNSDEYARSQVLPL